LSDLGQILVRAGSVVVRSGSVFS